MPRNGGFADPWDGLKKDTQNSPSEKEIPKQAWPGERKES